MGITRPFGLPVVHESVAHAQSRFPFVRRQAWATKPASPARPPFHSRVRRCTLAAAERPRRRVADEGFRPPSSLKRAAVIHAGKLRITRIIFASAMIELERDRGRIEPNLSFNIQHRTRHRHPANCKSFIAWIFGSLASTVSPWRFRCRPARTQSAGKRS